MRLFIALCLVLILTTSPAWAGGVMMMGGGVPVVVSDSYNDTFTYSDGALPTVSSGAWSTPSYASAVNVSSNVAVASTNMAQNIAYRTEWSSNDQCSSVTIGSAHTLEGPAVRISSDSDTFYWWDTSASAGMVYRRVSGTETDISSSPTALGAGVGGDVMKLCVIGTTITAYINGSSVWSGSDNNIASGKPGFRITYTAGDLDTAVGGTAP